MSEWYYTSAGQQIGPVTAAQLKQAAQAGQLTPADLVWKDGMPDWVPATKLKGIFDAPPPAAAVASAASYAPQPAAQPHSQQQPLATPAASQIAYYNPTAGLGGRLAHNLKGFPAPTGPQDQWPLSDVHLGQLAIAESHRKHIRALAGLFQFFFVLGIIGSVCFALVAMFGLALGGGAGRGAGAAATVMGIIAAFVIGFTILYYFAARETRRCRAWPAIVFAILYGLAILLNFVSFFMLLGSSTGPGRGPTSITAGLGLLGPILSSIIPFAFLWMCIKAMNAIPRFLACPVWAQEALVASKL